MQEVVYKSSKYLESGIGVWKEMWGELVEYRELVWRFFIRDISAKYKQTALGYVWAIFMPFVTIGTFVVLNRVGVLNLGELKVPYPLFALIGLTVWQLFATGLSLGTGSLVAAGGMIAKINFPRETLVFSSIAQALFELGVKVFLVTILFFYYGIVPSWKVIFFPFLILPIVLLTLGLSLVLSLVNGIFRDTANAVTLLTTFLMFLTPVLYPVDPSNRAHLFFKYNFLTPLVKFPRDMILFGTASTAVDFIVAAIFSLLLFLIAWRTFHLVETKIPERI